MVTVGVVVVAYGAPGLLEEALAPLAGWPTVVVDNSSLPAVRQVCVAAGMTYVDATSNVGFASGVNLGVRILWATHGRCDVLLLNPDALVTADAIGVLRTALHAERHRAVVAPALRGAEGDQRVLWPWPTPGRMWREALGLLGASRHDGDWVTGAVLLMSADAYQDVGEFDERFFLYAEETDWQRRAAARGWQIRLVEEVSALHVGAATSADSRRRETLFHAGTEIYIRKWYGAHGWASYRFAALTGAMVRSCLPGPRGRLARRRAYLFLIGPCRVAARDS